MPTKREELNEQRDLLAKETMNLFDTKKMPDGTFNLTEEERKTIQENEKKMGALFEEVKKIDEDERLLNAAKGVNTDVNAPVRGAMQHPNGGSGAPNGGAAPRSQSMKSVGQLFVESAAFKGYERGRKQGPEVEIKIADLDLPGVSEFKTVIDSATSYQPQAIRIPYISPFPTRPIAVADIIPTGTTTQNAVVYMEETTYTNAAAETTQGTTYPQSYMAFTQRTALVQKIATYIAVTDELMEDAPQAEAYVNNRLGFAIRQRLDSQLISGNGTPPNLFGILNTSGVQTQATGSDTEADACHKAMTLIQAVGFADATQFILHPYNWQKIHLMKTSQGAYIYGAPWEQGPGTLWGLPVVSTTAITANTGLCGAFTPWCQLFTKKELAMSVGYVNDDFIKGQLSIRAELRVAFPVFRPTAFCSITGMGQ